MTAENSWRNLYRVGAVVGFLAVAALVFDIVLATLPGWDPTTAPTTASGWLNQAGTTPLLAARNLDLLNVVVSLVSLPFYLALAGSMRKFSAATALLGLIIVAVGTTLFASANAALPMIELGSRYGRALPAERLVIESAATALLASGAHGSAGSFAGFFVSEIGTLLMAVAMLGATAVYSRRVAVLGIIGTVSLMLYSAVMTFTDVPASVVVVLAAPGGLLMIAWQFGAARRLWSLSREGRRQRGVLEVETERVSAA